MTCALSGRWFGKCCRIPGRQTVGSESWAKRALGEPGEASGPTLNDGQIAWSITWTHCPPWYVCVPNQTMA